MTKAGAWGENLLKTVLMEQPKGCKVERSVPMKSEENLDADSGRRDPLHPSEGRGRCRRGALELKFLL